WFCLVSHPDRDIESVFHRLGRIRFLVTAEASIYRSVRSPRRPGRSSRPSFAGGFSRPSVRAFFPGGKAAGGRRIWPSPPRRSAPPRHNRLEPNERARGPPPEGDSG